MRSSKYFVATLDPGVHTFVVHTEAKDALTIDAQPGETYFVSGSISMGLLVGHPKLVASTTEGFEHELPKLKLVKPLDE